MDELVFLEELIFFTRESVEYDFSHPSLSISLVMNSCSRTDLSLLRNFIMPNVGQLSVLSIRSISLNVSVAETCGEK